MCMSAHGNTQRKTPDLRKLGGKRGRVNSIGNVANLSNKQDALGGDWGEQVNELSGLLQIEFYEQKENWQKIVIGKRYSPVEKILGNILVELSFQQIYRKVKKLCLRVTGVTTFSLLCAILTMHPRVSSNGSRYARTHKRYCFSGR